ncbi:MAG: hypothetical protein KatS3mg110_0543 [Pirellulaceae bacterium]|nr:MAG: hypothetical protein KatS3mg110_0543 [Pirellulaceae bacterium]
MKTALATISRKPSAFRRPGMAVLLVLMMVAMTLAVAFAVSRVQTTALFVDRNHRLRADARTAAHIGMSIALRTIHTASWAGVGSSLSGSIGSNSSYQVTFQAGDPQLTSSHPDYPKLPYRVTITSVGTAVDEADSRVQSSHTITAVVELVPQATTAWPSDWNQVQAHQVYQWADVPVLVELPVQWSGSIWTQGSVSFAPSYPTDDSFPFFGHLDEVAVFNKALSDFDLLLIQLAAALPGTNVAQAILNRGPLAYWRLDEPAGASVAADAKNFQPGKYFGAKPGQTQVPFGSSAGSAYFDGFNDAVDCGNFNVTTSQLTLLCWYRVQQFLNKNDMYLVGKALNDDTKKHLWSLMLDTKGKSGDWKLKAVITTTSGTKTLTGGTLTSGQWYFAALVYDGAKIRLYLNGLEVANASHSGTLLADSQARVFIGDCAPDSARARLLRDCWAMAQAGQGDWRSLIGTWKAPSGKLPAETVALLQDDLRASVQNITVNTSAPVIIGAPITGYRLYPGGVTYMVPAVGSVLSNTTLAADPQSNPLGIFRTTGSIELQDNVTIRGTLLVASGGSVKLKGKNINWEPILLPLVDGESRARRLPALVSPATLEIEPGAQNGFIRGAIVTGDQFRFAAASDFSNSLQILGRLVAKQISCEKRSNWPTDASTWQNYCRDFLSQTQTAYFPLWLKNYRSLRPEPQLVIAPDPSGSTDHWPDWMQPIFVIASGKSGLRWNVIRWNES